MVKVVQSNSILEELDKYDVILVGTNCYQSMANGFQYKVSLYYPYVLKYNYKTKYGDVAKLGSVVECKYKEQPLFALLFITKGYNFRPDLESDYLSYEALDKCMKLVNILYNGKNIATSLIGCSRFDGNGNKDKVLEIIEKNITDCNITLYDYYQESKAEEDVRLNKIALKIKSNDRKAYYALIKEKKEKIKYFKKLKEETII